MRYSYGRARVLLKLSSHAGRLRECTAGKGKPRETVLLHNHCVSIDKATLRLSLYECPVRIRSSKFEPEPVTRLGPKQDLSK